MLGAQDVEQGVRMVSFKGIKDLCTKFIVIAYRFKNFKTYLFF
jgi:hypothetical protein